MDPTTSGRFRVHDRRPRPDIEDGSDVDGAAADAPEEFVLVELPDGRINPTAPDAEEQFDPLYATAEGYEGEIAERVASLEPGHVVDATLAWTDASARIWSHVSTAASNIPSTSSANRNRLSRTTSTSTNRADASV
ncbi:DUF6663 family protein, partial [Halorubrum sp. Ea8]|uniref:DUF6663 family protein n=1 Tax=Halorubrum sp. Ea8 TaxID=1383841 RepID=UPI002AA2AB6B